MSIGVEIAYRVSQGQLFPLIPKAAGSSPRRAMFVSEVVWNLLSTVHDDEEMEDRLGKLLAVKQTWSNSLRGSLLIRLILSCSLRPATPCGKSGACVPLRRSACWADLLSMTCSSPPTTHSASRWALGVARVESCEAHGVSLLE